MEQHHTFHRRRASTDGLHYHFNLRSSSSPPVPVWDCGSSLYDSYELSTFTQHLQGAIAGEGSALPSASILVQDGRARSLSMPHDLHFTPSSRLHKPLVKEENPMPADVDFSHISITEPLHRKLSSRVGIPKFVQRLFTKSTTGAKKHDLHSKTARTPFERILYTAVHYC